MVDYAEPTGSVLPHQLIWLLQALALAGPRFPYRRPLFTASILACAIWLNAHPHFTNRVADMQPYALSWAFYVGTLDKLLLSDPAGGPEASFWRRDRRPREAMHFAAFGLQKLKWAFLLVFGVRGIGWNFEVKKVPPAPTSSRWGFVAAQVGRMVYHYLVADFLVHLGIRMWFTSSDGVVGLVDSTRITLRSGDWREQFVNCLAWGMLPYHAIQMQYSMCALVAVLLGLSDSKDWPPFFGKLRDVTTVRAFWGEYWHQTVRKAMNSLMGAVVDLLGIHRGTNASSYIQLWLAFGISGMMHALQMRMFPAPRSMKVNDKMVGMGLFFFCQAAAITVEDFVQWAWRQVGGRMKESNGLRTLVGYAWVTLSFWYSIPFAADVMLRMRVMEESPLPFSIFAPLLLPGSAYSLA